jgi:hypothetical protein
MENHSLESKLVGCEACTKPSMGGVLLLENNNELVLLCDAMELCNVSLQSRAWFLPGSSLRAQLRAKL